ADEGVVRTDDQDAGAAELPGVGVEEVGGTVQAHGGLAGSGATLDADAAVDPGPHDLVLLGLDARDDVPHRPGAGPFDLGGDERREPLELLPETQQLVLEPVELAALETEPAPPVKPHGVPAARPVEGPGDVGPPVDDDGVAGGVLDVAAAQVEDLAPVGRGRRGAGPGGPAADAAEGAGGGGGALE